MKTTARRLRFSLWALLLTVALVLAACGGDDRDRASNNPDPTPTPDAGTTDPTPDTGGDQDTDPTPPPPPPPPGGTCTALSPAMAGDGCDPLCQTGCPEGGACVALPQGNPPQPQALCTAVGEGGQGASCGQNAGCQAGFLCGAFEEGAGTTCFQMCRTSGAEGPSCPSGLTCVSYMQGETRVGVCIQPESTCSGYPNDNCPQGQNCYPTNAGDRCIPYSPTAQVGDSCQSPTDCGDAQICLIGQTGNTCAAKCLEDTDCTAGQCIPLAGVDDNGNQVPLDYGACGN
jgi:hypothetical protein